MLVVPVLDLRDGLAVHAVAGRRADYRPVSSVLSTSSQPGALARGIRQKLGLDLVYVADLDAIQGGRAQLSAIDQIVDAGCRVWLDLGLRSVTDVCHWLVAADQLAGIESLVVGLESLPDPEELMAIGRILESQQVIFSLDLYQGRLWNGFAAWDPWTAEQTCALARDAGFRRLLVLEIDRVGTGWGAGRALGPQAALSSAGWDVRAYGGGVRGKGDLVALEAEGWDAALVGTALHSGRITRADLDSTCGAGL